MDAGNDTCIARRRTPRACTQKSSSSAAPGSRNTSITRTEQKPQKAEEDQLATTTITTLITKTPGKPKSRKRVRFSDPGPHSEDHNDEGNDRATVLSSTGLTPMIRRSSLGSTTMTSSRSTDSPSAKRRRHCSMPVSSASPAMCSPSSSAAAATARGKQEGSIHFPSLRQILSDRVKRRIRRNGLSEEMNAIEAERKKAQQQGREAEVEELRRLLAAKDAEIERLREMSMLDADSSTGDSSVLGASEAGEVEQQGTGLPRLRKCQPSSPSEMMTVCDDSSSKLENLEREVEQLRQDLIARSSPPHGSSSSVVRHLDDEGSRFYDWTMTARDPFSDEFTDMDMDVDMDATHLEDSAFGDSTMIDLVCSTPSRRQRGSAATTMGGGGGGGLNVSVSASSFPTPPCTSPTIPATPCSIREMELLLGPVTPSAHTSASVQACLPDPEAVAVKAELESLRLELGKMTDTLESQAALQARIAHKISSGLAENTPVSAAAAQADLIGHSPEDNKQNTDSVETQLDSLLRLVSDRTAALQDLNTSLTSLGFSGADASEVIISLTSSLRAARLELEYLTPGELALPLTAHGAQVLDLVLTSLRDLARKEHEHEQTIDEYHALELSLRQQLSARVSATDALRAELRDSNAALAGRDDKISDLEVGIDRLKGAAEGYRRDIAELETLVQRMEDDMLAAADASEIAVSARDRHIADLKTTAATSERKFHEEMGSKQDELDRCTSAMSELGAKLASVIEQTETFDAELSALHADKEREIRALNKRHGQDLAVRDARVGELKGEIDAINTSLRRAYGTIQKLRVENMSLAKEVEHERNAAKVAIDGMKAEMQKVVKVSSGFLATPRRSARRSVSAAAGDEGVATPAKRRSAARASGLATSLNAAAVKREKETEAMATPPLAKKAKRPRRYDSGIGMDEDE